MTPTSSLARRTARALLRPSTIAIALGVAVASAPLEARADVTSWLSAGFGRASVRLNGSPSRGAFAMPIDLGVGLPPSSPVVIGVGARFTPYFGQGSSWATYGRAATRGYVTGGFGIALDAGGYARAAGGNSTGGIGTLNIGLPWGFVVAGTYARGTHDSHEASAVLALDFLRLTVYRLAGEQQWANVFPAWRPE